MGICSTEVENCNVWRLGSTSELLQLLQLLRLLWLFWHFWLLDFLSTGSFKMVKNCKKSVNQSRWGLILEWIRPFPSMKFCREIRKNQVYPNIKSVFHLYYYVFYKKIKTVKKGIFCIIFGWSTKAFRLKFSGMVVLNSVL